ncbi:hypothetical protein PQZ40_02000 [Alphaproteobacteria bacterium]|nr:hypothetical protein [Alphaproteobacteria bacterium]
MEFEMRAGGEIAVKFFAALFLISVIALPQISNAGPGDAYSCVTKAQSGLSIQDDQDNPKQRKFYHSSHEKVKGSILREPKKFRFIWTESGLVFSDLPMHNVWGVENNKLTKINGGWAVEGKSPDNPSIDREQFHLHGSYHIVWFFDGEMVWTNSSPSGTYIVGALCQKDS